MSQEGACKHLRAMKQLPYPSCNTTSAVDVRLFFSLTLWSLCWHFWSLCWHFGSFCWCFWLLHWFCLGRYADSFARYADRFGCYRTGFALVVIPTILVVLLFYWIALHQRAPYLPPPSSHFRRCWCANPTSGAGLVVVVTFFLSIIACIVCHMKRKERKEFLK